MEGRRVRGGVVRRAPAPLEPLLDLRLEPRHDRGAHRSHVHGGRRGAVRRVRLERRRRSRTRTTSRQAERAFHAFRAEDERPTLIVVHSHIGYGTPVEDTPKAHGEPLGPDGVRAAKRFYGWPEDAEFLVPDGVRRALRRRDRRARCARLARRGRRCSRSTAPRSPSSPTRSSACSAASCRTAGTPASRTFPADAKGLASRDSSGQVLNAVAERVPWLVGGAADLAPSTKTRLTFDGAGDFGAGRPQWPQLPLRRPRVRVRGDRERARALEAAAVLVGLPHLLGLRARRDPALRADGDPRHPHLHARLDRRRRGRPDASAGRAARVAARDARPARVPPGRRERGRRDLALRHAAPPRARRARALAAGAADGRPLRAARRVGRRAGRVRAPRHRRRCPT